MNNNNIAFYNGLEKFVDYVNNFPFLYNENINRLKYYQAVLTRYFENTNLQSIEYTPKIKSILLNFYDKGKSDNFVKASFVSIIIVYYSYKQVVNFIPKRNFFTKKIEKKIDNLADFFYKNINFENKISLDVNDIIEEVERVLKLPFFKTLVTRQKFRFKYRDVLREMGLSFNA